MTKEIIEKYIQFAIENGYKKYLNPNVDMFKIGGCFLIDNIHGVFMQKEFIEAVARGIVWNNNIENHKDFKKEDLVNYDFSKEVNDITIRQAIAIRDGKLEEFILNLIK